MESHSNFGGETVWSERSELPWNKSGTAGYRDWRLFVRLVEEVVERPETTIYLRHALPEIASEFAAQWAGVLVRRTSWQTLSEFGRLPLEAVPLAFLLEVLDRDRAGLSTMTGVDGGAPWKVFAVPLHRQAEVGEVLVMFCRSFDATLFPSAAAAAAGLGWGIEVARDRDRLVKTNDRLKTTLRIVSQLSTARDSKSLLELIARESARLLDADRASIFLWDRVHHELVACQALGFADGLLRIPDRLGIVGECLHSGTPICVDDAYADVRFNRQVDLESGYKTRNLLCVPLRDATGQVIGVFELINKRLGDFLEEDQQSLSELGVHAATALGRVRELEHLDRRHKHLTEQVTQGVTIIGKSAAISVLRGTVERLAATELPILILGESGTGKEVVAQSLHYLGPRRDAPFIPVNCAAVAESLLENELFGHEKGAFTDARESRPGKFELAEGGTLFLDEIGDMSAGGQAKLLRVLEEKRVTRVGGAQSIPVNVRVVAATNVNLATAVREKRFREDLYYRLSVVSLELPPLRDRPEDVIPLAEFFLEKFSVQARGRPLAISPEARARLSMHPWPGNVRELRNLMERVAFLCQTDKVEISDLEFILAPSFDPTSGATDLGLAEATDRFQQDYIRRMIKRVNRNMTEAAELLGLHRSNLYRKMHQLGMSDFPGE